MLNKYSSVLLILILLTKHTVSFSQKIDLNTCLKMADTASLAIRNARLDLEINKEQRGSFLSARLPQLNFNADYTYNAKIPGQVVPATFSVVNLERIPQFNLVFHLCSVIPFNFLKYCLIPKLIMAWKP